MWQLCYRFRLPADGWVTLWGVASYLFYLLILLIFLSRCMFWEFISVDSSGTYEVPWLFSKKVNTRKRFDCELHMCAYMHIVIKKNLACPCSAFFSVFSSYLVLCEKDASVHSLEDQGTPLRALGALSQDAPRGGWTRWMDASAGQVPSTARALL